MKKQIMTENLRNSIMSRINEMGCNEIMELNALKKIEGVPDDITK